MHIKFWLENLASIIVSIDCEGRDWNAVAQDRIQWCVLVNTGMSIQVP
jgi:hypothetical protein